MPKDEIIAMAVAAIAEEFFLQFPTVMLETVPRYELNGKISALVQKLEPPRFVRCCAAAFC